MRIERVDDTTVKLFITYSDIEARGFSREDLWSNRKRGEEFFWSMMDEINEEEDFVVEGPLWIQVHAFEKGVEVTISKSKNEDAMNMSDDDTNHQFDDQVNELLAQTLEGEESLEDLFEQRKQQKKNHQDKQQRRAHKPSNVRNIIV
ncbi:adaptor protein MecA, partial [Staphylococcus epidermidis]